MNILFYKAIWILNRLYFNLKHSFLNKIPKAVVWLSPVAVASHALSTSCKNHPRSTRAFLLNSQTGWLKFRSFPNHRASTSWRTSQIRSAYSQPTGGSIRSTRIERSGSWQLVRIHKGPETKRSGVSSKFVYCLGESAGSYKVSSWPKCFDVGIFVDETRVRHLALSSKPFLVMFKKAPVTESSKFMAISMWEKKLLN